MELIDREKLKSAACDYCCENLRKGLCARAYCSYLRIIDEQPTVDAVEVVRCRDCVNYSQGWCFTSAGATRVDENWYCADGERREE